MRSKFHDEHSRKSDAPKEADKHIPAANAGKYLPMANVYPSAERNPSFEDISRLRLRYYTSKRLPGLFDIPRRLETSKQDARVLRSVSRDGWMIVNAPSNDAPTTKRRSSPRALDATRTAEGAQFENTEGCCPFRGVSIKSRIYSFNTSVARRSRTLVEVPAPAAFVIPYVRTIILTEHFTTIRIPAEGQRASANAPRLSPSLSHPLLAHSPFVWIVPLAPCSPTAIATRHATVSPTRSVSVCHAPGSLVRAH